MTGTPARARIPEAAGRGTSAAVAGFAVLLVAAVLLAGPSAPARGASPSPSPRSTPSSSTGATGYGSQVPLLAYYYIWYTPTSWNRLKIDYPLIGRYSSDDVSVMREQVAIAKQAGLTGFLVSWKDTPKLDRRLAALRSVAAAAGFKLGIVIEGRDFYGNPISMKDVRNSFSYLAAHYASDPVFNIFGKLLVAWSGTWLYSLSQLKSITSAYGSKLTIVATEKEPSDYKLIASLFHGDAYYWSSVNPQHTPGYRKKLSEFSSVVHQTGGLWIAPAAPGFDARLLGGVMDVRRRRGQTLRLEMNAAMRSAPDAIGLISWNEYSENSEIEPSEKYGNTALRVIASIEHAKAPVVRNFNSSSPAGFHAGPSQFVILAIFLLLFGGSVVILARRRYNT